MQDQTRMNVNPTGCWFGGYHFSRQLLIDLGEPPEFSSGVQFLLLNLSLIFDGDDEPAAPHGLLGGFSPSLKKMRVKVNWDDEIPNILSIPYMGKLHIPNIFIHIYLFIPNIPNWDDEIPG